MPLGRHVAGSHGRLESRVRTSVSQALARHVGVGESALTPGAALVVEWGGTTIVREACGWARLPADGHPRHRRLDLDTRFDLASVTKGLFTTASLMRLIVDGRLALTTRIGEALGSFRGPGKAEVTVAHLLGHDAGLPAWAPVYLHARDRDDALAWVAAQPLTAAAGRSHAYSDLGFMLLGGVLEAVTGRRLDVVAEREVIGPLGLQATGYRPRPPDGRRPSTVGPEANGFAATSQGDGHERRMVGTGVPYPVEGDPDDFDGWREHTLVGEANDGNAWHAFSGVAGHAGAFGTADDLTTLARNLLAGARGQDNALAPPPIFARFLAPTGWNRQALGWWRDPGHARAEGRLIGHSGFTGCRIAVDPASQTTIVLLTNRQQLGDPAPDITPLWRELVAALPTRSPA